tara:strand:- start:540 stop:1013 length:474 start_codon:yes stop_codon:yes gene_type:complete
MKLTKETLKRIILEELNVVSEQENTPEITKDHHREAKKIAENPTPAQEAIFRSLDADPKVKEILKNMMSQSAEGAVNEEEEPKKQYDPFEDFPVATTYATTMTPVSALMVPQLAAKIAGVLGISAAIPAGAAIPAMLVGALIPLALAYIYDKKGGRI